MKFLKLIKKNKKRIITIAIPVGVFVVLVIGGGAYAYNHYQDRIYPGISIGSIDLSGLDRQEATAVLVDWNQQWLDEQLHYRVLDERGQQLNEVTLASFFVDESSQSVELIWYDLEEMLDSAFATGRDHPILSPVVGIFNKTVLEPAIYIDEERLTEALQTKLADHETQPQNAQFDWPSSTADPLVISEQEGNIFDYQKAVASTRQQLLMMENEVIEIPRYAAQPDVYTDDLNDLAPQIESIKEKFPLKFNYDDAAIGFERHWTLYWKQAYNAVQVEKGENGLSFALDQESLSDFWERIESLINIEAQDAKFEMTDELYVEQFQPSRQGAALDQEGTLQTINDVLANGDLPESIDLGVNIIEPQVSTADVNDLGITEILGVGYSDFSGSPANRIANIRVAVNKLNGLLIKPGEEFSLLSALRPFTVAGGYLPELVIKGDQIIPEIAGGLCQIGTTTFRAAMKSGLNITQRRNHSLVVSYYNDHRNGNPGTDATIYDPAPDMRFINDTDNYILFTTNMNVSTGDLTFIFWGTSDGRIGNYSQPVVLNWVGAGETKYVETTDLEPGKQKCQGAHPGANTSFVYSITRANGEEEETTYTSHYRALPQICLVGVDPDAEPDDPDAEPGDPDTEPGDPDAEPDDPDVVPDKTDTANPSLDDIIDQSPL